MADAVTTNILRSQTRGRRYAVHLTGISDGTGETNVVKVDKSTLTDPSGAEPGRFGIVSVRWNVQNFTYVKVSTDHTTDDTMLVLTGNGYDCFEEYGALYDPNSAGGTGDLLLSTVGPTSGATYDITIELSLS